ncbi:MAG: hypothetical protein P8189_18060, partial [Anaerolineae bacterium]
VTVLARPPDGRVTTARVVTVVCPGSCAGVTRSLRSSGSAMVTGLVSSIDRGDTMAVVTGCGQVLLWPVAMVVTELGAGVDGQVTIRPGW